MGNLCTKKQAKTLSVNLSPYITIRSFRFRFASLPVQISCFLSLSSFFRCLIHFSFAPRSNKLATPRHFRAAAKGDRKTRKEVSEFETKLRFVGRPERRHRQAIT